MTNKQLVEVFDKLPSDIERWKWIKEHQHTGIVIQLYNDDTYGLIRITTSTSFLFQLDAYVGNSDGVFSLLKAMGIKSVIA